MSLEPFTLTRHAQVRCQQRGIPYEVLRTILEHGDQVQRVKGGAVARSVSLRGQSRLVRQGLHAQTVERTKNVYAVTSEGRVLTAFHGSGRRARTYRKGSNR